MQESLTCEYAELLDPDAPLDARIRCLYRLKEGHRSLQGAQLLLEAVDTTASVLLQHELLYNVGQFGFAESVPRLIEIISATEENELPADLRSGGMKYDVVSRHEAIEALGAIGKELPVVVPVLEHFAREENEPQAPIRESCELALERLRLLAAEGPIALAPPKGCRYASVDPAPALREAPAVALLKGALLSPTASLWDRYRCMFQLRNLGTEEAVMALSAALRDDRTSCLFRHEVAFVLGQLEHPASAPALAAAVRDVAEHPMVRHEAAEALGALAEQSTLAVLEEFCQDEQPIVRDSCVVAIEMHKYWSAFKPKGDVC
jgi:deoxyhypusine monooxygenase